MSKTLEARRVAYVVRVQLRKGYVYHVCNADCERELSDAWLAGYRAAQRDARAKP